MEKKISGKRKAALAAALVAAAAGGGAALAAGGGHAHGTASVASGATAIAARGGGFGHHHGPGELLAAAASYLGLSESDLRTQLESGKTLAQVAQATSGKSVEGLVAALVAAEKQELDAAVAAGRVTQAQEDQILATIRQRITDLANGKLPAGPPPGGMHRHGDGLAAAASYLGLSESDLRTQLESGKTLAQVAQATSGKSVDGLVAALVAAAKQRLDAAVAAGRLTQAQEDQILATLQQRITDLANGVRPSGPPPGGPGHFRRPGGASSGAGI